MPLCRAWQVSWAPPKFLLCFWLQGGEDKTWVSRRLPGARGGRGTPDGCPLLPQDGEALSSLPSALTGPTWAVGALGGGPGGRGVLKDRGGAPGRRREPECREGVPNSGGPSPDGRQSPWLGDEGAHRGQGPWRGEKTREQRGTLEGGGGHPGWPRTWPGRRNEPGGRRGAGGGPSGGWRGSWRWWSWEALQGRVGRGTLGSCLLLEPCRCLPHAGWPSLPAGASLFSFTSTGPIQVDESLKSKRYPGRQRAPQES